MASATIANPITKFNDFFYLSYIEETQQALRAFNADSRMAITYEMGPATRGGVVNDINWGYISTLVYFRQAEKTPAARTEIALSTFNEVGVKFGGGAGPLRVDREFFDRYLINPEMGAMVFARQLASGRMRQTLNIAIDAAVNAVAGESALLSDIGVGSSVGAANRISVAALNKAAGLFGDQRSRLVCWVMHGDAFTDLVNTNLGSNFNRLFYYDGPNSVSVMQDNEGRIFVITDAPELNTGTGAAERYNVLGLVPGGIKLVDQGDLFQYMDTANGWDVGPQTTWQAKWTTKLSLKGMAWKTATSTDPTEAQLGTASNWTKVANDDKSLPGVVLRCNVG